jgi:hypothetical protein
MTSVHFDVYRGTAPTLRFTLSPVVSGGIGGWTTQFSARRTAVDADPLILAVAGVVYDPTLCIIDVPLTKAQTLALAQRLYTVSLERTDAGAEDLLALGSMNVILNILNAVS